MIRGALLLLSCMLWNSPAMAETTPRPDIPTPLLDARQELKSLREELETRRLELRELDQKERGLLEGVGRFDEDLARLEELERRVTAEEAELRVAHDEARARLAHSRRQRAATEQRIRSRLRSLYVLGHGASLRVLLGAQSYEELAVRRRAHRSLARLDDALRAELQRTEEELRRDEERQRALFEQAQEARAQLDEQRELIRTARQERDALMERIEGEKELQMRAVREIVQRQRELTTLLGELPSVRGPRTGVSAWLRRGLLRPTAGPIERTFGVSRVRETGAKVTSNGIEISAPRGAPVVAPADGVVVHVGWVRGFGQLVILDHGDGYHSLHAHLSTTTVRQGSMAQRGEPLGAVGDTESLTGPKLYFELRHHGRPLDPAPYLR